MKRDLRSAHTTLPPPFVSAYPPIPLSHARCPSQCAFAGGNESAAKMVSKDVVECILIYCIPPHMDDAAIQTVRAASAFAPPSSSPLRHHPALASKCSPAAHATPSSPLLLLIRHQRSAATIRRLASYDKPLRDDVVQRTRGGNAHVLLTTVLGKHISDVTVVVRRARVGPVSLPCPR